MAKLPKGTTVDNIIIRTVKKYGGIVVGSYAVKTHIPNSPQYNDIDIIIGSKASFSKTLISELNKYYPGRFTLEQSFNAMRIWDNQQQKYVADVANYPITRKDYIIVQGVYVAKPEFVYKGRQTRDRTTFGFGVKKKTGKVKIQSLTGSKMGLMPKTNFTKFKRFI